VESVNKHKRPVSIVVDISNRIKPFHGYKVCPVCGGEVEYAGISSGRIIFPGVSTAQIYICKKCGYQGSAMIEVDTLGEVKKMRKYLKSHKGKSVAPTDSASPALGYPKEYVRLWRALLVLIVLGLVIIIFNNNIKNNVLLVIYSLSWIVIIAIIIAVVMHRIIKK
jgi:hypothetical protein